MTDEALKDPTATADTATDLVERVDSVHLGQRLYLQAMETSRELQEGVTWLGLENSRTFHVNLYYALKATGLFWFGNRNFRAIQVRKNEVRIPRLPEEFDGFIILHLSDLHLDLDTSLTPVIIERIRDLEYDLCVITGDFRAKTCGDSSCCLEETEKIVSILQKPAYGILGNHDFIEMVPPLEDMGLRMLINESVPIHSADEHVQLCGIEDPHLYRLENFEKTLEDVPEDCVSILLSHSPETYGRAAAAGFDFMLSGHTHGGQICLPGRIPVLRIGRCPARMLSGAWRYRNLQGYTSAGTGSCGVAVRFFCPPEVTLHTLRVERERH